ncbi:hypothetical protein L5515_012619 [Caenorhabditis briggsae]|uniref:Delta-like protein n=1 Tax=Caenorhabditis briggsae TaxID=6238 RepID=A0AAE9ET34_CAEBR|nr:hypothetical protein L5515_012619 [Caenorhabditis briggsae]
MPLETPKSGGKCAKNERKEATRESKFCGHGPHCDKFCNEDHATLINRRCTHHGTLGCPYGFRGTNCDIPMDQAWDQCPCGNHGFCVSEFQTPLDTVDRSICQCSIGEEGDYCEKREYDYADAIQIEMHGTSEKFNLLKQSLNGTTVRNELIGSGKNPDSPFSSFYEK